jgi:hypothetical protein
MWILYFRKKKHNFNLWYFIKKIIIIQDVKAHWGPRPANWLLVSRPLILSDDHPATLGWRVVNKSSPIILFWAESIQFLALTPLSLILILILSTHLGLSLPQVHIPADSLVKILRALLRSSILATWPAHLKFNYLIRLTILGERYKLWHFSLWNLLHFPFSSLLGPNIRLRILFQTPLVCIPP